MTSSKSNKWIARAIVAVVALLLGTGVATAETRKRLVVLNFEGDDAEEIQSSFVKFLKKSHTVVSIEKWDSAADELGATKVNEKNVKKVAKKLKIDGVITGNVEKRREEYIIRIKLRAGASGALVGSQVNAKTDAPKLSKQAKSDLKDELFGQIDGLESVRGGGDEEEEEAPKKGEEEEEEKPSKFGGKQMKEEEEKPVKLSKKEEAAKKKEEELAKKEEEKRLKEEAAKAKEEEKKRKEEEKAALATKKDKEKGKENAKEETEEEEEESPLPKPKKNDKKKTAKLEEDEEGIEEEIEPTGGTDRTTALSPGNRAVDAVVGVSMNMRRMSFSYDPTIGQRPAGYKGKMVPGGFFDMAVYPLALGHKRKDMLKNIGATFMYDQVLLVKSKDAAGKELKSAQVRYAFGVQFRYPFNQSASSPVIGARLRYGQQSFRISQPAPLPSVTYSMIEPGVFFRMPLMSNKLVLDANLAFLAITNTGQIQDQMKYGSATVSGFEMNLGADYHLGQALFLRGLINFETIGFKFNQKGALPTPTDNMKVSGARDSYYGLVVSAGYLF